MSIGDPMTAHEKALEAAARACLLEIWGIHNASVSPKELKAQRAAIIAFLESMEPSEEVLKHGWLESPVAAGISIAELGEMWRAMCRALSREIGRAE